jgi:hypothetical protein
MTLTTRAALAAFAWAALIAAPTAQAQTFRCKNDLAQVGDAKASVLQKCGDPILKDSFCKPVERVATPDKPQPVTNVCETVDEWTYNPGPGQFMTILRFESGALRSIRYGDRIK